MCVVHRFSVVTKWLIIFLCNNGGFSDRVVTVVAVAVEMTLMEAKIVFVPFNVEQFVGFFGFKANNAFYCTE